MDIDVHIETPLELVQLVQSHIRLLINHHLLNANIVPGGGLLQRLALEFDQFSGINTRTKPWS